MSAPLLSLIAAPGSHALDTAAMDATSRALTGAQAAPGQWLAEREAWETALPAGLEVADISQRVTAALGERPVDVNVLAPGSRRKKLLVADMESTVIEQECLDELADYAGVRPRIAGITERAMRGELDFETALKERVGLLKGLEARVLQEIYDQRVTLMPGAAALVATMRQQGATCALVSGGFTFYTERIAARVGFDLHQANHLDIAEGHLTGTVAMPILGREAKLEALQRLAHEHGLAAQDTLAVGDGANDLAMIKAAGLGVAFRAKPIVAAQAQARVRHGDLTALLYLQGYAKSEWVPA